MKRSELKEMIREIINEKKNDFVATGEKVNIAIHNSSDEDANIKLYNDLVDFLKKIRVKKPKQIDITY